MAHTGDTYRRRCPDCDAAEVSAVRRAKRPTARPEIQNLRDVLLAGAATDPVMAPHVRLASHLPKDELEAAWTTQELIDLIITDLLEAHE
jgi:hypothetical protein